MAPTAGHCRRCGAETLRLTTNRGERVPCEPQPIRGVRELEAYAARERDPHRRYGRWASVLGLDGVYASIVEDAQGEVVGHEPHAVRCGTMEVGR